VGCAPAWLERWEVVQRFKAKIFNERLQLAHAYNAIINFIQTT
jgi:hypothetical protein